MTYLGTCSVPEEKVVKEEAEADSLNVLILTVLAATTAVAAAEGIT
jgi:hypothetical protein